MKLSSSAFTHEGAIPAKYTCQGEDTSPLEEAMRGHVLAQAELLGTYVKR